jgi:hypothetical protein
MKPFKDCVKGKSKIKIILKSSCLTNEKIQFNINTKDDDKLEELFDKIKELIIEFEK